MMQNFIGIKQKLEAFTRKYYINELIKGMLLFLAIGLLYLIFTLLLEHFLWMNGWGRAVLFWLVVGVIIFLLYRFIGLPLFKLFKLKKGISYEEASGIIGKHFPEVGDKLLNVLQLSGKSEAIEEGKRELLLAGIEQKSAELKPFAFHFAVDLKKNLRYAKYVLIPVFIVILIWISGNINWFSDSYNRVVHYGSTFEPPAPFEFYILNGSLNGIEGTAFKLEVKTVGDVIHDDVEIHFKEEVYFMQEEGPGSFSYVFEHPEQTLSFYLSANDVRSRPYQLQIMSAPAMIDFKMYLTYPSYLKRSPDTLTGTGNAVVPEGTEVRWNLKTRNADEVKLVVEDSVQFFSASAADGEVKTFGLSRRFYKDTDYELHTGNDHLPDYESLGFGISVVKDEHPEIVVREVSDSISEPGAFFVGQVSDDHGFYKLRMKYYPENAKDEIKEVKLKINTTDNFFRFVHTFPDGLALEEGVNYMLYYEVTDNDALRAGKSARSRLFSYRVKTSEEIEEEQLREQKNSINALEQSLSDMEKRKEELKEVNSLNMEKKERSFNDMQKIDQFLDRQLQQEKRMQEFTKRLEDNLKSVPEEKDDVNKKLLEERLNRQKEELEKNEKLLEELKKVAAKINRENMAEQLEKLSKSQQNNKRSLEQILELTKRYYVTQKAEKLSKELKKLGEEQENAANKDRSGNEAKEQEKFNKRFEDLRKEADALEEENQELKKPMELGRDKEQEKAVKEEQKKALEHLNRSEQKKAGEQQRKAGKKMQQMSKSMQMSMQSGTAEQDMEDAEVLRQILKNVVAFSFEQEDLMKTFNDMREGHPTYAVNMRKQHDLKEAFQHIDDSLFALSLRQPKLADKVNKEITNVHFYIDKALERFAENQLYRGVSDQQYTFTAANNLAALLGNILDNMQQSMGTGQGKGKEEIQLPDIIQSQEELNEQMKRSMEKMGQKEGEGKKEQGQKQGDGEGESEDLFEIYKQQQMLRQALEKQLMDKLGKEGGNGKNKLLKDMEQVEEELLKDGFNERTFKKMLNLKHELLKLKDATFKQGEENRRESTTGKQHLKNTEGGKYPELNEYLNGMEILNRQVLPLRQIYKEKVKEYFKEND